MDFKQSNSSLCLILVFVEEEDDGGLDDWEAMVSDEDEEKGERVNTKRMYFFLINSCSQGFVFCLYRKQ